MKNNKNSDDKGDIIDIISLLSPIWINKKVIFKITLLFFLFGIIYGLSIKNSFRASSIFYPHIEQMDDPNSLRSLAGIAGFNLDSKLSENLPSSLYPMLIKSPIFKIDILDQIIEYENKKITFRTYLMNEVFNSEFFNIKDILTYPINFLKNVFISNKITSNNAKNILNLSDEEYRMHYYLDNMIIINLNQKQGFIELIVEDRDPYIASQVAKKANEILQKSIIDFKIKNIKDTYKFISSEFELAKLNFYELQDSLAIFKDNNINIKSDLFKNKYSRLESEYKISENLYNELAINKQKISIDVKKNTPIFTIIKPVVIPNEKYQPNRTLIVIVFLFMGLIIPSFWVIFKNLINNINFKN
tara:strand:+ start:563 stop:1639 length:1077 start_codon:yes stop_codon:yes gene_type:complete